MHRNVPREPYAVGARSTALGSYFADFGHNLQNVPRGTFRTKCVARTSAAKKPNVAGLRFSGTAGSPCPSTVARRGRRSLWNKYSSELCGKASNFADFGHNLQIVPRGTFRTKCRKLIKAFHGGAKTQLARRTDSNSQFGKECWGFGARAYRPPVSREPLSWAMKCARLWQNGGGWGSKFADFGHNLQIVPRGTFRTISQLDPY